MEAEQSYPPNDTTVPPNSNEALDVSTIKSEDTAEGEQPEIPRVERTAAIKIQNRFTGTLAPLPIRPVPPPSVRRRARAKKPAAPKPHNKPFTCTVCQKGVGTKGGLRYHLRTHLIGRPFKCDKCEKSYSTKNDLSTHYKRHLQQFTCDYCDKKFTAKDYLLTHIGLHHLPKTIPCVDCCKVPRFFSTHRLLRHHYVMKVRNQQSAPNKFKCKLCDVTFPQQKFYQKHCEDRELLKYSCLICGQKFPCIKLRDEHLKKERKGKYCKICKTNVADLYYHVLMHHRERKCQNCNVVSIGTPGYIAHSKTCEAGKNIEALGFQCSVCSMYFGSKFSLVAHANREHPNFWCHMCSKGVNSKKAIYAHMREHFRRVVPYKCLSCPVAKFFSAKIHFDRHFDCTHGRLRMGFFQPGCKKIFVCDMCKVCKFRERGQLLSHLNICQRIIRTGNTAPLVRRRRRTAKNAVRPICT